MKNERPEIRTSIHHYRSFCDQHYPYMNLQYRTIQRKSDSDPIPKETKAVLSKTGTRGTIGQEQNNSYKNYILDFHVNLLGNDSITRVEFVVKNIGKENEKLNQK